jgi:hypothetical protein
MKRDNEKTVQRLIFNFPEMFLFVYVVLQQTTSGITLLTKQLQK